MLDVTTMEQIFTFNHKYGEKEFIVRIFECSNGKTRIFAYNKNNINDARRSITAKDGELFCAIDDLLLEMALD